STLASQLKPTCVVLASKPLPSYLDSQSSYNASCHETQTKNKSTRDKNALHERTFGDSTTTVQSSNSHPCRNAYIQYSKTNMKTSFSMNCSLESPPNQTKSNLPCYCRDFVTSRPDRLQVTVNRLYAHFSSGHNT
uniref:Uncharacterized protein n=1 Tax=Hippocampus comes TaxID=109280 RepID=A0A3Q2XL37_HIPCM